MRKIIENKNICIELVRKEFENYIAQYDKIIFFESQNLLPGLSQTLLENNYSKSVLVLSIEKISLKSENVTSRRITKVEAKWFMSLYFTYQFSDKFVFVSREKACFPTIFNFMELGLLTMEEALEALLC